MKKGNRFNKTILILLATLVGLAIIHFIVFPQQTRCILINYSSFQKEGSLYADPKTKKPYRDSLQTLVEKGRLRLVDFWGEQQSNPLFIYCSDKASFEKYGNSFPVPALTHIKLGARIVISEEGLDEDIIAHEMTHAELYQRIGFFNWSFKIPRWFDEGLAMQNDYRNYYSEDTLKALSDNYKNLPDLKTLETGAQFNSGSREKIMFNYMTAAHELRKWYTKEKLEKFIKAINDGKSFEEAYNQ
jgi:hypothetical protein